MVARLALVSRLDTLAATLWQRGAEFAAPTLDPWPGGDLRFELSALLPGPGSPIAPEIRLMERWTPDGASDYRLAEYAYEFLERPLDRRRAFHRHHEAWFVDKFAVAVHEHCEEVIGEPECRHYFGLPIDPFEAVRRFMLQWGQPGPLACDRLPCMG